MRCNLHCQCAFTILPFGIGKRERFSICGEGRKMSTWVNVDKIRKLSRNGVHRPRELDQVSPSYFVVSLAGGSQVVIVTHSSYVAVSCGFHLLKWVPP